MFVRISLYQYVLFFVFSACADLRDLHSFPTRRSSDLTTVRWAPTTAPWGPESPRLGPTRLWLCPTKQKGVVQSGWMDIDRKSTRLNSSHVKISYAVFCLKKKIRRRLRPHSGWRKRRCR